MAITTWEPLRDIEHMFDRYSKALGWPSGRGQDSLGACDWSPRVDICEMDNQFLIKAEIPEVKKEDVKVSLEEGVLSIQGERKQEKEEKGKRFHRMERSYGSFMRSFTLPNNVDEGHIHASFRDGMLVLDIPKTKTVASKPIEIAVEA